MEQGFKQDNGGTGRHPDFHDAIQVREGGVPITLFRGSSSLWHAFDDNERNRFRQLIEVSLDRFHPAVVVARPNPLLAEILATARSRGLATVVLQSDCSVREPALYRDADAILAPSQNAANYLREAFGLPVAHLPPIVPNESRTNEAGNGCGGLQCPHARERIICFRTDCRGTRSAPSRFAGCASRRERLTRNARWRYFTLRSSHRGGKRLVHGTCFVSPLWLGGTVPAGCDDGGKLWCPNHYLGPGCGRGASWRGTSGAAATGTGYHCVSQSASTSGDRSVGGNDTPSYRRPIIRRTPCSLMVLATRRLSSDSLGELLL